jgi:hypothetical protein
VSRNRLGGVKRATSELRRTSERKGVRRKPTARARSCRSSLGATRRLAWSQRVARVTISMKMASLSPCPMTIFIGPPEARVCATGPWRGSSRGGDARARSYRKQGFSPFNVFGPAGGANQNKGALKQQQARIDLLAR